MNRRLFDILTGLGLNMTGGAIHCIRRTFSLLGIQVNHGTDRVEAKPCDRNNKLQLWICSEYPQYGK